MLNFRVEKLRKSLWENCVKVLHSFDFLMNFGRVLHVVKKFYVGFSTKILSEFNLFSWRFYTFST